MDSRLKEKLSNWNKQIDRLHEIESYFLDLEGSEKSLLAELTIKSVGKSMSERESMALASHEFKSFKAGLSKAKSEYNHAKRKIEIFAKAFDAEYLTYKTESNIMRRDQL